MKILILSDGSSIHTKKWLLGLLNKNCEIHLFSLKVFEKADIVHENFSSTIFNIQKRNSRFKALNKINYLKVMPALKKIIKEFKPDILHAHYASSYGLLGVLSGFKPICISAWGSDINSFPQQSFINKAVLKYNLKNSDVLLSSSESLKDSMKKYTDKDVTVIPFGIDTEKFKTMSKTKDGITSFNSEDIVIGTIKLFEKIYGIDLLIKAFSIIKKKRSSLPLKLLLVGDGAERSSYEDLCHELDIRKDVVFTGMVEHNNIPQMHNEIDIFVALSHEESFGVAILEAQACSKPVVVSNVGGLPEVVEDGVSGLVVPSNSVNAAADAIEKLVFDSELRERMGASGRERVLQLYDWERNVGQMMDIYNKILDKRY